MQAVVAQYRVSPDMHHRPSNPATNAPGTNEVTPTIGRISPTLPQQPQIPNEAIPNAIYDDDDDSQGYIPLGLADFVAAANRELEETQKQFLIGLTPSALAATKSYDDIGGEIVYQLSGTSAGTPHVGGGVALNGVDSTDDVHNDATLWSPDLFVSPRPNPVTFMSDSQIKEQALGFSSPIPRLPPPPPPYHVAVAGTSLPRSLSSLPPSWCW